MTLTQGLKTDGKKRRRPLVVTTSPVLSHEDGPDPPLDHDTPPAVITVVYNVSRRRLVSVEILSQN